MKVDEPFARHFIEPGRSVATHRPMRPTLRPAVWSEN